MNKIQDTLDELLVITSEEAGELVQACTKILRHGTDKTKINQLLEEVGLATHVWNMNKLILTRPEV